MWRKASRGKLDPVSLRRSKHVDRGIAVLGGSGVLE